MTSPLDTTAGAVERREQLLAAALDCFAARGYAATTIKQIAAAAGVAGGLLYHYFASKEALLLAVVERFSLLPEVRQVVATAADRPAREVLGEVARRFDQLLQQRAALVRLLWRDGCQHPAVDAVWRHTVAEVTRLLGEYLTARIVAGELRPHRVELTVRLLLAPVAFVRLRDGGAAASCDELVELLLGGLLAAPAHERETR
ncbi:MAG: TetR/AcrR family transcriptional regulator [Fimbriimonadaceae bacterium]|nr:TetR/AcrR family transcriptional regulator [Fimbriimonadaceae bacterium]